MLIKLSNQNHKLEMTVGLTPMMQRKNMEAEL